MLLKNNTVISLSQIIGTKVEAIQSGTTTFLQRFEKKKSLQTGDSRIDSLILRKFSGFLTKT